MLFNEKDYEQMLDGLDSIQQVKTLREVAAQFDDKAHTLEPDAMALIRDLYPDYAVGGKLEGKQFVHKGVTYQLQITRDYNYANHSTAYAELEERIQSLKEEAKTHQKVLTAMRKQILLDHPRLRPTTERIAIKVITK